MSLLSNVTTGRQVGAQIHVIAGQNGVGKTTWASSFPRPLILDLEDGSKHIDVPRLSSGQIPSIKVLREILKELLSSSYQTVVFDSVESLEGLIFDSVCAEGKVTSIEDYGGGYGKGYQRSREVMREIFSDIKALQTKGITTILVAHTQTKTIHDPATNQTYDRIIMRANDKMAALIRDLADNCFFATHKVFLNKENGKDRAYGDGQRVMYTQWRPGFDAKNRLELPLELPLSYDAFVEACGQKPEADVPSIEEDIKSMSEKLDPGIKKDVQAMLEKYKGNPTKLKEVKNRLMKLCAS